MRNVFVGIWVTTRTRASGSGAYTQRPPLAAVARDGMLGAAGATLGHRSASPAARFVDLTHGVLRGLAVGEREEVLERPHAVGHRRRSERPWLLAELLLAPAGDWVLLEVLHQARADREPLVALLANP